MTAPSPPSTLAELVAQIRSRPTEEQPTPPPAPIPGGGVATNPSAIAGTEWITSREVAALAGKLAKSKSENKQSVGRALLKAICGEVWAGPGHRNGTSYMMAAELIEAYPNLDPNSVCECFSAAISNLNANHEQSGKAFTEETLLSQLERVQADRQNRLNMIAALGGLVGDDPAQPWPGMTAPGAPPPPVDARAAELNALGFDTLIIRANGDFYLRTPDRGTFDWKLTSALDLRVKMVNLFGRENKTVNTHVDGEFVGAEKICEVYARVADRTVHDYTSPSTTFDPATAVLSVGLPANLPEARFDPRVERWSRELAGGTDADLGELYDWISGTTREYIDRPAAALVISGARDAGKSLFMLALAGTWGVLPVELGNTVERFGGALLSSPFWHADERMPEDMTEAAFRKIVPERVRLIEPKGREKVELRGCGRLVFSINSVADLHVGSNSGPDAIDAVAGRIAFFDCSSRARELAKAQDAFRLPHSYDLDLPAMIGHFRWVQTSRAPRPQRFFGARQDGAAARSVVLNQSVRGAGAFLDLITDYLENPADWEKDYRATSQFTLPGRAFPLVTRGGRLYVWGAELAARLNTKSYLRELDPICMAGREKLRFGLFRGSYREIDVERLVAVRPECRADLIRTCSSDTHERMGLTTG